MEMDTDLLHDSSLSLAEGDVTTTLVLDELDVNLSASGLFGGVTRAWAVLVVELQLLPLVMHDNFTHCACLSCCLASVTCVCGLWEVRV